jgi:arylsulfatase A-like enzyme
MYLHASDPHYPYTPREPFRSRFAPSISDPGIGSIAHVTALIDQRTTHTWGTRNDLLDLYDGEIAFNDLQFGRLLSWLEREALTESTMVVLLSDHGEEFLDHGGWGHGRTLFEEQLHVPLIIRFPRGLGSGLVIESPVRQIDIVSTILDYLREPELSAQEGQSLLPLVAGGRALDNADPAVPLIAFLDLDGRNQESVTVGQRKLIRYFSSPLDQPHDDFFDLGSDPRELSELSRDHPVWRGYLASFLARLVAARRSDVEPKSAVVDGAVAERLKALGYLE